MTSPDLKSIEFAIAARAKELARSLAERNPITIERAADTFDETLLAVQREASARMMAQDFQLLRQIEAARDRIRDGSYGICLGCEETIAPKRLQAIPWAAYCVRCQAQAEQEENFGAGLGRAA